MVIQLLLSFEDRDYMEHLLRELSEHYADVFSVSVCSRADRMEELFCRERFDVALVDNAFAAGLSETAVRLPLLLWDERRRDEFVPELGRIRKYQRISSIAALIQQQFAEQYKDRSAVPANRAHVLAVWSPSGGCGKTTIALAYAAQKAARGKSTAYLDLEPFSSTGVYFPQSGKGLSAALEKLNGNLELVLQSIRRKDASTGIEYYGCPDNYEDLNILSTTETGILIDACAAGADELVVDLGSVMDGRTTAVFERADTVFLITDGSGACETKLRQFRMQHNLFDRFSQKTVLVANMGARTQAAGENSVISVPLINAKDPVIVYKTLSAGRFDE